ncbi:hypothetical protein BGX26_010028 [Mortierella sp. AD094]|nr:hypothetical protein BGX26_010028 [Mortierella sp. AD094]
MANMINSTKNIPDAALGQRYTPKLYPYEIGCNKLNIQLLDINFSNLTFPRTDGCAAAGFALSSSFDADYSTLKTANVSENRVSLTVDGVSQNFLFLDGLSVYAILSKDNTTCHTADVTDDYFSPLDLSDLFSNLMSYPKTTVTKCVLQSGEVKVISLSTTRFMSSSAAQFRVSADAVFDEYDELLQSMGSAVGNAAYASNSTMFLEVRSNNTSIDSVSCYSFKDVETILLSCVYLNINMLILKQQEINVDITNARDGREFSIQPKYTTAMAIRHIPKMPHSLPENTPISMMKNATLAAAQYMASLGQNFYADYAEEQLYVVFDVADIEEGLEIPDWLVAVVIALAVSSFSLWAWTMKSLESIFTNSMYDVVSKSIKGVSPVIMRSKINPLQVDACLVIPNNNNLNDNNANNKDNNSDGEDDEHDHYSGMEGHKLFRERYVNAVGKEEIEMTDIA